MPEYGDPLSEREIELLRLVATGVTNREIAYRLDISVNTVKVHVRNIFTKIGAESRTEATMIAVRERLIQVPVSGEAPPATGESELAPQPPPVAPLPWLKRALLIGALLLAAAAVAVTWPRGERLPGQEGADLPPERSQAGAVAPQTESGESRWHVRAQMPTPRAYMAVIGAGSRIFAIGGRTSDGTTGAVEIYDPQQDLWTRGADKPTPTAYVGAAALGNDIYVPGGCNADFGPTAAVEVYDVQADAWRAASPLPEPRCAYALAALGERLYLFGGRDSERYVGTVYIYDLQTGDWTESTPMEARGFAAATILDDRIMVIGGYDGRRELTTCEAFEPAAATWQDCVPLTVGRGSLGLAVLADKLYAIGGGGWTSYLGFNESFSPAQGTWSPLETPLVGEWRSPGVVVLENSIYAVGGWSGRYLGLTEVYEALPFHIFIPVSRQE